MDFSKRIQLFFLSVIELLVSLGETVILGLYSLAARVGAGVFWFLLMAVEVLRVHNGIHTFELNPVIAWLAAIALVGYLGVQEMIIESEEKRVNYKYKNYRFSLALWWRYEVLYFLGLGNFSPEELSPAHYWRVLSKQVKFVVITLSIFGSLNYVFYDVLELEGEGLYRAVWEALWEGNGEVIFPLVAGTIYTIAVVRAIDGLSKYISKVAEDLQVSLNHTRSQQRVKDSMIEVVNSSSVSVVSKKLETVLSEGGKLISSNSEGKVLEVGSTGDGYYLSVDDKISYFSDLRNLEAVMRDKQPSMRSWKKM